MLPAQESPKPSGAGISEKCQPYDSVEAPWVCLGTVLYAGREVRDHLPPLLTLPCHMTSHLSSQPLTGGLATSVFPLCWPGGHPVHVLSLHRTFVFDAYNRIAEMRYL